MVDVYALSVFLAAAEARTFSEAARQLSMSQPAVSMQIHRLERRLGLTLFTRQGRHLQLTEEGQLLLPLARELVQQAINLEVRLEALKQEVSGALRIGCSTTVGKYILPRVAAEFRKQHPQVQINILNLDHDNVLQQLEEGHIHLAVSSTIPTHHLQYRHFFTDPIAFVVPSNYLLAQASLIEARDLKEIDFILQNDSLDLRQEIEQALRRIGLDLTDLKIVMEIGNPEAIIQAVELGIGAAFMSRSAIQRSLQLGILVELLIDGITISHDVFIVYNPMLPASAAQMAFWNFVQAPKNQALLTPPPVHPAVYNAS